MGGAWHSHLPGRLFEHPIVYWEGSEALLLLSSVPANWLHFPFLTSCMQQGACANQCAPDTDAPDGRLGGDGSTVAHGMAAWALGRQRPWQGGHHLTDPGGKSWGTDRWMGSLCSVGPPEKPCGQHTSVTYRLSLLCR